MIDRWHDMAVSRKAAPSLNDEDRLDHFKTLFTLSTGIRNWLHGPGGTSKVVEKPSLGRSILRLMVGWSVSNKSYGLYYCSSVLFDAPQMYWNVQFLNNKNASMWSRCGKGPNSTLEVGRETAEVREGNS